MPLAQLAQLYGRAKHEKCKNVKQSPTPAPMRGYKFAGSPQSREWSPFFWWWGGWGCGVPLLVLLTLLHWNKRHWHAPTNEHVLGKWKLLKRILVLDSWVENLKIKWSQWLCQWRKWVCLLTKDLDFPAPKIHTKQLTLHEVGTRSIYDFWSCMLNEFISIWHLHGLPDRGWGKGTHWN